MSQSNIDLELFFNRLDAIEDRMIELLRDNGGEAHGEELAELEIEASLILAHLRRHGAISE